MDRYIICPQYCPSPFCVTACPANAMSLVAKEKNVYCEPDKCNKCGICREMCTTFSQDRVLEKKRPWISSDWIRARAI